VLPVDCPLVTAALLADLAAACTDDADAAVPQTGPLPGAYRRSTLPVLEQALASGRLSIRDSLTELRTKVVPCDEALLTNVNTPDDLRRVR
jgi:molybdopterin-guanine dinucleotide biosynthesis protein A